MNFERPQYTEAQKPINIFKEVFEKKLRELESTGYFSAEEVAKKREFAATVTEDQIVSNPAHLGEIMASARIIDEEPREEIILDIDKYKKMACQLEEKHREEIEVDECDYIDCLRKEETIGFSLGQFPREMLEHYVGHGVRNTDYPVAAIISILENNVFIGEVGHLVAGFENCPAYTTGSLLIISHKNKSLAQEGTRGASVKMGDKSMFGTKIDPGVAFVCNLPVNSLVEDLRKMFPHVKILRANEIASYFNEEENANKEEK